MPTCVRGEDIVQAIRQKFPGSNIELVKAKVPCLIQSPGYRATSRAAKDQLGYEPDYPIDKAVEDYGATSRKLENLESGNLSI